VGRAQAVDANFTPGVAVGNGVFDGGAVTQATTMGRSRVRKAIFKALCHIQGVRVEIILLIPVPNPDEPPTAKQGFFIHE